MAFENISGNDQIKVYLQHMVEKNRVGNSLLFAGPPGPEKALFAEELAKILIANDDENAISKLTKGIHPDLRHYRPEGKIAMHSIDTLRQFGDEVYLSPNESPYKVFIIHDAERMLPYSANALLKTFEEPLRTSVIILLSDHPEKLMSTILSRCRKIYFQPTKEIKIVETEMQENILKLLSQGKVSLQTLKEILGDITEKMDVFKKNIEDEVRASSGKMEDLSASQKEIINKEIDGAVALGHLNEVNSLYNVILSWYRDMHLLKENGNPEYLYFPHYKEAMESSLKREEIKDLIQVEEYLQQAKLAVERFTPLNNALETLFFKLNIV